MSTFVNPRVLGAHAPVTLCALPPFVCVQDKSWRVRYNVAHQLVTLCNALGPEATRAELVSGYVKLLRDAEAEVRVAAAGKVSSFCKMLVLNQITSQVSSRHPGAQCHDQSTKLHEAT